MKRVTLQAYGVIPVHFSSMGPRVLVAEQYSAQGTHWGFIKGARTEGERPHDAAIRHVMEQASVRVSKIIDGISYSEVYSFTYEDTIVDKSVDYFIGYVDNPGLALQVKTIKNASWYDLTDARNRLTFLSTRDIFDKAMEYLEENEPEYI